LLLSRGIQQQPPPRKAKVQLLLHIFVAKHPLRVQQRFLMHHLQNCPACNHTGVQAVFPGLTGDNTLARLLNEPLPFALPGFDLAAHATSDWHACKNCALLFARNRPDATGLDQWYPKLFQYSEERNYNIAPLPQAYLDGKARSAQKFFAEIESHGVFAKAKSLIHFRTGPGHFLAEAKKAHPGLDIYGLEYFEHPAAYARTLVGGDNIEVIALPEPKHGFARETFDVVVANHFLTHAHDPGALMTYFRQILSEDGTLVLYNELDHDLSLKSMTAYARGLNFFHKQLFSRQTLLPFVESCGFAVTDISTRKNGKLPKYVTLLCRKAAAKPMQKSDHAAALKLLQSWRRKHIFYKFGKPVIDPIRRLVA
jgi:SAM-dependent methyltransferase